MGRAAHRARHRWRRLAVTLTVVTLATLAAVLHPWTWPGHAAPEPSVSSPPLPTSPTTPPTSSTAPTTAADSSSKSTVPKVTPDGTYAVGSTSVTVTVPSTEPGASESSLSAAVWYPATAGSPGPAPDLARAPYPVLVFSQGYALSVQSYQTLLTDWASAGFVVVAPTYPHTDPSDPSGLEEGDIVHHPADLGATLATVRHIASRPGSPLSGMIDGSEVGVVGHSDGGDVSLAVADNSCCRVSGVQAAAILSGAELASFGGAYFTGGSSPLLVVQGSADTVNPPYCSVQIYDAAPPPKYYLDLVGAGHEPPYVDPGSDQTVVAQVTTEFFDAELKGQRAGLTAMTTDGNVAGAATLTDGPTAPPAPAGCPGAP